MRKIKVEPINLDEVLVLNVNQCKQRYNIGANTIYKLSDELNGSIKIGKRRLFLRSVFDDYFNKIIE
jgi:hypothetical protein